MSVGNINQGLNGLNSPLSYMGVNATQPSQFRTQSFDPSINDSKNFALGAWWLNTSTLALWYLASLVGNSATWIRVTLNGASFFEGNSGGIVTPDITGLLHIVGDGITVNVVGNPGTNTLTISAVVTGTVTTLTGNSGGAVSPTAGNINVVGDGTTITIAGNPGTSTLTATAGGTVATSYPTDAGTAIPAAGALTIHGTHGLNTSGAASTVTVAINNAITLGDLASLTGSSAITATTGNITLTAGNLNLSSATNAGQTIGIVTYNGERYISNFGTFNQFIGGTSGNSTLTGRQNTGVGRGCGAALTSGTNNNMFGLTAGLNVTSGSNNVLLGQAGVFVTTGGNNVMVGEEAGSDTVTNTGVTTGSYNVLIGDSAGDAFTSSESSNIIIGGSISGTVGTSNTLIIGNGNGTGNGQLNRAFIRGIRGITTGVNDAIAVLIDSAGQLGTVSSSIRFKENVVDMLTYSDDLMSLRPVVFNYKKNSPKDKSVGLIAEEVESVMPDLVVYDEEGLPQTVKYNDLVPMLLNEVQKLHRRLTALENKDQ